MLVFDGAELPLKKGTNKKRGKTRKEYREKAIKALERKDYEEAKKKLAIALSVNPDMVYTLV